MAREIFFNCWQCESSHIKACCPDCDTPLIIEGEKGACSGCEKTFTEITCKGCGNILQLKEWTHQSSQRSPL